MWYVSVLRLLVGGFIVVIYKGREIRFRVS